MILVPTASDQRYLVSQRPGIPLVCIDRPAVGIACDTVIVDNEAAGFTATSWLIAHGHRRIAFVGGPADKYTIKLRRSGYERALVEAGIEPDRAIAGDSAILPSEAGDVVRRLLRLAEPVTAVLTSNAKASIGVVHALHQVARTDVAMVGFDDFPMADTFSPPVTVVNQNPEFIGHQAIELLFRRLGGDHDLTPSQVMIPIELIARGSGEIPPPAKTAGQAPLSAATS
jgi:LacI family transcriptional regulator